MTTKAHPKPHKELPYPKSYSIAREGKYRAARKRLNMSLRFVSMDSLSKSNELCFCRLSFQSYHYKLQFTYEDKLVNMCPILIALGYMRLYLHNFVRDNLDVGELLRMAK